MQIKRIAVIFIVSGLAVLSYSLLIKDLDSSYSDLEVKNVVEGRKAVEMIKKIHLNHFEIKDGAIVELKGDGEIRVWMAYAESVERARELKERMAKKVEIFFSKPETVEFNGIKAYRVYGAGRTHYFFSVDNIVVWVEFESRDGDYQMKILKELFVEEGIKRYIN